ncbi:protein of unknown function [Burkholderia multivorans]
MQVDLLSVGLDPRVANEHTDSKLSGKVMYSNATERLAPNPGEAEVLCI